MCVDILDVTNRLTANGTLDQSLCTAVAGHMVTTRAENCRNPRTHADLTQALILNVHEQLSQFFRLRLVETCLIGGGATRDDDRGFCGAAVGEGGGGVRGEGVSWGGV